MSPKKGGGGHSPQLQLSEVGAQDGRNHLRRAYYNN